MRPLSLLLLLSEASSLFLMNRVRLSTQPEKECICAKAAWFDDDNNAYPGTSQSVQLVQAVNGVCPPDTYAVTNTLIEIQMFLQECRNTNDPDPLINDRLDNCLCIHNTLNGQNEPDGGTVYALTGTAPGPYACNGVQLEDAYTPVFDPITPFDLTGYNENPAFNGPEYLPVSNEF
jgi:hypothetical protein